MITSGYGGPRKVKKMRTIKTMWFAVIAIVMAVFCFVPDISAQTSLPMIQSQDALRNYALGKVVRGGRSVSSQSIDWSYQDSITYVSTNGTGVEDVLEKLFSVDFTYRLINPSDNITGYVWLYDENNNSLFYSNTEFKSGTSPRYEIWMNRIPLLTNVSSAEIFALDQDGVTARRYPVDVNYKDQLLFDYWMAGATNGILVVKFKDGTLTSYMLSNPVATTPAGISEQKSSYKIQGHYVYTDNQKGGLPTIKIIETWEKPTVYLEVVTGVIEATFDVIGLVYENGQPIFERPLSMEVSDETGRAEKVSLLPNGPTTIYGVNPGKYRIRFNWNKFGQPNTLYTGPEDNGGGGGGKG